MGGAGAGGSDEDERRRRAFSPNEGERRSGGRRDREGLLLVGEHKDHGSNLFPCALDDVVEESKES